MTFRIIESKAGCKTTMPNCGPKTLNTAEEIYDKVVGDEHLTLKWDGEKKCFSFVGGPNDKDKVMATKKYAEEQGDWQIKFQPIGSSAIWVIMKFNGTYSA